MLEKRSQKTSYLWLIVFMVMSLTAFCNAGFDDNVVYYAVLFVSLFAGVGILKAKEGFAINRITLAFCLFILWSFISIFWSIVPIRSIIEWLQLIAAFMIYLLTRKLSKDELNKLVEALMLVAGGLAVFGILTYPSRVDGRIYATFTHPNPFAIFMVMIFLVSLSFSLSSQSKKYLILSPLYLSAIFLSGSRASMVAMAAALIIPFFSIKKENRKKAIIKLIIFFASAVIVSQAVILISSLMKSGLSDYTFLDNVLRNGSFSNSREGRLEFWRVALALFKNKPLTGYGLGTYFSAYSTEYGMNIHFARFAHNHYLQIAAETGIVGIGLFLFFLWNAFRGVLHNAKQSEKTPFFWGMVAGILAFLLHIGVDFTWNFPAITMLFFFFLGVATKEDIKAPIKINKSVSLIVVALVFLINAWQLLSILQYTQALVMAQSGRSEAALQLTQNTNRIYPISPFGRSFEGELLFERYLRDKNEDDLKAAFAAMEKAIQNSPYDWTIYATMADMYKNIDDFENAEKYFLLATKYSSYVMTAFTELGELYLDKGLTDKAEEVLTQALERAPYAIERAALDEKMEVVASIAETHLKLIDLYDRTGNQEKYQEQENQLAQLKEEYPFLEEYLKEE